MILEFFILFQIVMLVAYAASFFTKNEVLWAITIVLSGILMINSFNIETTIYIYDVAISAYAPTVISNSYPYMFGINMMFFSLSILFCLFDIFKKYGVGKRNKEDDLN